jgi:type I restriction enzyme S subunit
MKISDVALVVDSGVSRFRGEKEYVKTGNVLNNVIVATDAVTYENRPSRANMEVRKGDVLCAKMRETKKVLLITASEQEYLFSTGFAVLRPKTEVILPGFLLYYLRSRDFQTRKDRVAKGATQKAANNSALGELPIPVPPLGVQERIVPILERLDSLEVTRERANKLTNELIQSLFLDMFGDPAVNPMEWEVATVGDIVIETQYGLSKAIDDDPGHIPIVRMNNITPDGRLDLNDLRYVDIGSNELAKYGLAKGDVLFNRTNSRELVGKTGLFSGEGEFVFASYLIRVRVEEKKAVPEYLWAFLNSYYGKRTLLKRARGAIGQANINAQELRSIDLPLPPIELQLRFASLMERVKSLTDKQTRSEHEIAALSSALTERTFSRKEGEPVA